MPSKQETFDTVVAHLRKQGRKAVSDGGGCCYRAKDGCKCAAGCLIPDDRYDPAFEGQAVWVNVSNDVSGVLRELGHDLRVVE